MTSGVSKRRGRYRKPFVKPADYDAIVAGLQELIARNQRRREAERRAALVLAAIQAREDASAKDEAR